MFSETEMATLRRAYARQMAFFGGVDDPALESAYAAVRREAFLGDGPWPILRPGGYRTTPDADRPGAKVVAPPSLGRATVQRELLSRTKIDRS